MPTLIPPTPITAFPGPLPNVLDSAFRQQALVWVNHLTTVKIGEFNALLANVNNNAGAAAESAEYAETSRGQAQTFAQQAATSAASGAAQIAVPWTTSTVGTSGAGATPPTVVYDPLNSPGLTYRCIAPVGPTSTRPKDDPTKWAVLGASASTGLPVPQANRFTRWDAAGTALVNVDMSAVSASALIGVQDGASASTVDAMLQRLSADTAKAQIILATEAAIDSDATLGSLQPNRFYRSSSPNKLFFATAANSYFQVNAGGGGAGAYVPKVVVIGDSSAAQHPLQSDCWPKLLADRMRQLGAPIDLINLSVGGWTWNKANTLAVYNGKTMVQQAIAEVPDVLLIALGANDLGLRVEGRTLAQCQADCSTALNALRAALPSAVIVIVSEYLYDATCFSTPGTTLLNKGTLPGLMQKKASGILTDAYCPEMLDDTASSPQKTNFAEWLSLDAHARSHGAVNGAFSMHIWRAARLGCIGLDGVHLNMLGQHILMGHALKAVKTVPALLAKWPQISTNQLAQWTDPDTLFTGLFTQSGTSWVQKAASASIYELFVGKQWGGTPLLRPESWWAPSGGRIAPVEATANKLLTAWRAEGCLPMSQVAVSVDDGAFAAGSAPATDARGNAFALLDTKSLAAGVRTLRYKCGDEVHGPYSVTMDPPNTGVARSLLSQRYNGATTAFANAWTTIPFGASVEAQGVPGAWSGSTYTANATGYHRIDFVVTGQRVSGAPVPWGYFTAVAVVNGVRRLLGSTGASLGDTGGGDQGVILGSAGGATVYLAVGGTVSVQVISSQNTTILSGADGYSTTLTISHEGD